MGRRRGYFLYVQCVLHRGDTVVEERDPHGVVLSSEGDSVVTGALQCD